MQVSFYFIVKKDIVQVVVYHLGFDVSVETKF